MTLNFIRDKEKREINFVVQKNGKPIFAVECKTGEKNISKHIPYFAQRTDIPIFYQVHMGKRWITDSNNRTEIIPFTKFCSEVLKI